MTNDRSWEQTLTAYIREGEPDQATKSKAWQIAIGLQQVDRLETSDYLLGIAREHIEGRIDIHQAQGCAGKQFLGKNIAKSWYPK